MKKDEIKSTDLSFRTKYDFGKYFNIAYIFWVVFSVVFMFLTPKAGRAEVPWLIWAIFLTVAPVMEAFAITELLIGTKTNPWEKKTEIEMDERKLIINGKEVMFSEINKVEEIGIKFRLQRYIFEPRPRIVIHTKQGEKWIVKKNLTDYDLFVSELIKRSGLRREEFPVVKPKLKMEYLVNAWSK